MEHRKPTKEFLEKIVAKYEERTAELSTETAIDMMDTSETNRKQVRYIEKKINYG